MLSRPGLHRINPALLRARHTETPLRSEASTAMTYRAIVVHFDPSAAAERRLGAAVRLARAYDAQLLGLYSVAEPQITPFTATVVPGAQDVMRDEYDSERICEERFRRACADAGVARVQWRSPAGDPIEAAAAIARRADLTVLGQPGTETETGGHAGRLAHGVLMASGRPVFFVPDATAVATIGESVLIAWNDTRESARAISDAMPLLTAARRVEVVAVTGARPDTLPERAGDTALAEYLAGHGIGARVQRIAGADPDAGELILSHAADVGADLIVMGGYGRGRLTEMVWGGVTRTMLEKMTVPVLMAH